RWKPEPRRRDAGHQPAYALRPAEPLRSQGSKPMKTFRTALALALVAMICACRGDDPAALMASAKQYMEQREFGASIIQLKNLLQKNPDSGEARYLLGVSLLEQGDAVAAQIELDKAVKLGFSSDELQLAIARALLARGQAD